MLSYRFRQCRHKPKWAPPPNYNNWPSIFWRPFSVVTLLNNNRHTVFVVFYSCGFDLHRPFTWPFLVTSFPSILIGVARPNLQEKCVSAPPRTRSAPPQPEQESILGQFLLRGLDFEVDLDSLWGRRLKKGRQSQLFWKKVHPRQNPGYTYVHPIYGLLLPITPFQGPLYTARGPFSPCPSSRSGVRGWSAPALGFCIY